jgi:hypothetical protein
MRISEIRYILVLISEPLNLCEHSFSVITSGIIDSGMAQVGRKGLNQISQWAQFLNITIMNIIS